MIAERWLDLGGLRTLSVGAPDEARLAVVLLHGFAMEPVDLAPFAQSLGLPAFYAFPEGPLAAAPRGRAWWHIDPELRAAALARGPRDFAGQHPPDLPAARNLLAAHLDAVAALVPGRPLVVGGFSQGGMLVCDTLLHSPRAVAAMALLSSSRLAFDTWRPLLDRGALRGLPVLISHGEADEDLSFGAGTALRDCLAAAGCEVTWVQFAEGHQIPLVVWRHLRKLLAALQPTAPSR
ncbi:MAG: hypothetical protein EXR72_11845 [Myxococcales bacterium]|nr:hypothetical protein [Myxococcales bacterium]